MNHQVFSNHWKYWIWSSVREGCNKNEIFNILLQHDFDYNDIVNEMGFDQKSAKII
jgi:hypothetical protein